MTRKSQHAPTYQPIPGLLRSFREEARLTQRELASALTKPQSWVFNSEHGIRRVDLAEFVAWCSACGVSARTGVQRYLNHLRLN